MLELTLSCLTKTIAGEGDRSLVIVALESLATLLKTVGSLLLIGEGRLDSIAIVVRRVFESKARECGEGKIVWHFYVCRRPVKTKALMTARQKKKKIRCIEIIACHIALDW